MYTAIKSEGDFWTVTEHPGAEPLRFMTETEALRYAFGPPAGEPPGTEDTNKESNEVWFPTEPLLHVLLPGR